MSNYLESESITIIPHPPNSPDLSLRDFWLFSTIKQNLTDQNNSESLCRTVSNFMNSLDKEECRKTFDKWVQCMYLCIDNGGDYFEHLTTSKREKIKRLIIRLYILKNKILSPTTNQNRFIDNLIL